MAERHFVILRVVGKVPAMAGCEKCGRKFFTPPGLVRDEQKATQYLLNKFDQHECKAETMKLRATPY